MNQSCSRRMRAAQSLLPKSWSQVIEQASAFAPINIALVKYWGKRDEELHLPVTDSFSLSLALGTTTTLARGTGEDVLWLNKEEIDPASSFYRRTQEFLDLIRPDPAFSFSMYSENTVPTAAGLASSASGFAALTLALDRFFGWSLDHIALSRLARLGSGSACRSVLPGFMLWHKGKRKDGSDSYAEPFPATWKDLCVGIFYLSTKEKELHSRAAMKRSQETSPFYPLWPKVVAKHMDEVTQAIRTQNFALFGKAVEQNALAMHALMHTAIPPFSYYIEETLLTMKKIWLAREKGLEIYFTMDAGPNIKALFLKKDLQRVLSLFPLLKCIGGSNDQPINAKTLENS